MSHIFLCRENFPSHFKFKEYCPLVFRQLRERFGIDDSHYAVSSWLLSLNLGFLWQNTYRYALTSFRFVKQFCLICIFQASFQSPPLVMPSPGRSGAKFFISKDKRFYVKTIESEDIERLHNILPQYHHVSMAVSREVLSLLPIIFPKNWSLILNN